MSLIKVTSIQKKVLNALVDKYERSATFRGTNRVNQYFTIKPADLFPEYDDDAEYDFFEDFNYEIKLLEEEQFVKTTDVNGKIASVRLMPENLECVYELLKRTPKDVGLRKFRKLLLDERNRLYDVDENNDVRIALMSYIDEQLKRIDEYKFPENVNNFIEYKKLWKALEALLKLPNEIYIRDLSVRLYEDSKQLDKYRSKINSILFKYGSFSDKDTVLEECGVIRTPSYVMLKGNIRIAIGDNEINVGAINGGLAFPSESLAYIIKAEIYAERFVTIENLTSFYRFDTADDTVALYLGGYHNSVKREFLQKIYGNNSCIEYYHFGDMDAGGFYIYEHLRRKTGINFIPLFMDSKTLVKYKNNSQKLTQNDIKRIRILKDNYLFGAYINDYSGAIIETLDTMLELGIKLEQEAID